MRASFPAGALRNVIAACLIAMATQTVRAQPDRILGDVTIVAEPGCASIHVGFEIPVVYLRHFPYEASEMLLVFVRPLGMGPRDLGRRLQRETALLPTGEFTSLRDIVFEGDAPDQPYLSVLFTQPLTYVVRQGRDYRSIVIHVPTAGDPESCPSDR